MKLILHPFELPLRHTFTIAHDSRNVQETLIVELRDGEFSGYGEATANPYYEVTLAGMMDTLESLRDRIENYRLDTPEAFWAAMHPLLRETPFVQCALDLAAQDLYGKKLGKPLYQLWGLSAEALPITNYTIGIDSISKMVEKMKEVPWPLYKIKLGTPEDIAIVSTLRQYTNATFRVDANCAWTVEETIANAKVLKTLGVEFIEQPLPGDDYEGMEHVIGSSDLPLIADESCMVESDVARCHGRFHGINIKLTKCGGLTPARRMITEARRLGMRVMVGCMTESTVGISAIAQLLPLLDYVDMDGAMLLKEDVATGVTIQFGRVKYAHENGTGVTLLEKPVEIGIPSTDVAD